MWGLFLKLEVHSTYTEKLQRNELIKLFALYSSTLSRLMELAGRDRLSYLYIGYLINLHKFRRIAFYLLVIKLFNLLYLDVLLSPRQRSCKGR